MTMESFTQMKRFDKRLLFVISVVVIMIIFGPMLSFGAVFVTMMDTFQTDRAETAAVQSICIGVTFTFAGLISGGLITRFGPTMTILVGGVLVPLGICISYFAKHITYLYASIGVISGVGNSLIFSSCIVVVERVFEGPKRLLCLAVLNTSTAITAIFYPYLLKWLEKMYGFNGMFLILAGLSLNIFVLFTICWTNRVTDQNDQAPEARSKETEVDDCLSESSRKGYDSFINIMNNCFAKKHKLFNTPLVIVVITGGLSLSSLDGYLGVMLDIDLWKGMTSSQGYTTFVVFHS